jgi:DNA repair exonuclease SbcCD ATPase subunit
MHVCRIRMENWKCFAGVQELALEPIAYSVVARRTDDPGSSNWGGKSTVLRAPFFALWGDHGEATEDGWITYGEQHGGVVLDVHQGAEGFSALRDRRRGKSTQLTVEVWPSATRGAAVTCLKGDEAQRYIDQQLGIGRDDFLATCYFEQRQMARLVLARPQERMDVVAGWLRLDPLVRAEELLRQELGEVAYSLDCQRKALGATTEQLGELGDGTVEHAEAELASLELRLQQAKDALDGQLAAAEEARAVQVATGRLEQYDRLVRDGKELSERLKGSADPDVLAKALMEVELLERAAAAEMGSAAQEERERRKVALGQFDGQCPVAGIRCPAKDDINQMSRRSKAALDKASARYGFERQNHEKAAELVTQARAAQQEVERLTVRLDTLREQIAPLHKEHRKLRGLKSVDVGPINAAIQQQHGKIRELAVQVDAHKRALKEVDRALSEKERLTGLVASLERDCAVYREALLVFGKQGAQRRVAEAALREIEQGANGMLGESGIDLQVRVSWSRHGEGLAKACDACGHPFPASARVKECERCKAARGPLLVNRLELQLSDRSGAAEDLAGAALQLSASAWLRVERGCAWSTALLDEPYGSLDSSNRKAFSTHLATMLSGRYGFAQALVVSHTADTVGQLPGKIEIVNDRGRATVRVA